MVLVVVVLRPRLFFPGGPRAKISPVAFSIQLTNHLDPRPRTKDDDD
jgi:hypothetical protein